MRERATRRHFLRAAAGGLLGLAACTQQVKKGFKGRPNVVFVVVDDMGWADLGCYGSTFHETPQLDQFAATAMKFNQAYSAGTLGSPSLAALLTGRHPVRYNLSNDIPGDMFLDARLAGPDSARNLPASESTLAEALQIKGYKTFFAGKWNLGGNQFLPEDQGFAINKGGCHKGTTPSGYFSPYDNPKLEDGPPGEYLTDRLTDESIRFMREAKGEPFFLFLSHYALHTPIQPVDRRLKAFEEKEEALRRAGVPPLVKEGAGLTRTAQSNPAYASMIYALDENMGRLLKTLDELGLAESTMVIVTSGNGGLSTLGGRQSAPTSNLPLRAGKGWCYEGGIRVPLLVRAPGWTRPGSTCDIPVSGMDLFPTVLDYAGPVQKTVTRLDGLSLGPLLSGRGTLSRKTLVWHFPHYHASAATPQAALRHEDWKLVEFFEDGRLELYNLKYDPSEAYNLAANLPKKTNELWAMLKEWRDLNNPGMPRLNTRSMEK